METQWCGIMKKNPECFNAEFMHLHLTNTQIFYCPTVNVCTLYTHHPPHPSPAPFHQKKIKRKDKIMGALEYKLLINYVCT